MSAFKIDLTEMKESYIYKTADGTKYLFTRKDVLREEILKAGMIHAARYAAQYSSYFKSGTTVLDIGAHFGGFSMWVVKNFPNVVVHAWEPQKRLFLELCANTALNDFENSIIVHNSACGESAGVGWYLETDYKNNTNPGAINVCSSPPNQNPHKQTEILTIDQYKISNVSVIKIDVEGMELNVLRGATETIKRSMPIIFMESWEGISSRPTAIEYLKAVGYNKILELGDEIVAIPEEGGSHEDA